MGLGSDSRKGQLPVLTGTLTVFTALAWFQSSHLILPQPNARGGETETQEAQKLSQGYMDWNGLASGPMVILDETPKLN